MIGLTGAFNFFAQSLLEMDGAKYLLLGIVLTVAVFVLLMPFFRPRHRNGGFFPPAVYMGPYWYHGGGGYRPGVLY